MTGVIVTDSTPSRWAWAGLLLAAAWVAGALAAGFLLNRVLMSARLYDEVATRQAAEVHLLEALRTSVSGQLGGLVPGGLADERRFFVLEALAALQAENLRRMVIGDDRETVVRFMNLHDKLGAVFRGGQNEQDCGALGAELIGLLDEVAVRLGARREGEKAALRASLSKAGRCSVVALLFVGGIYFLVSGVLARVRREREFPGALGAGLAA